MNISIIGCEYFNDYQVLKWHLDELKITQITTCGNNNIDILVKRYADENNINLISLCPDPQEGWLPLWKEYYNLIDSCNVLLAFWFGDPNRVLRMINKAKKIGKEVIIVRGYHPDPDKLPKTDIANPKQAELLQAPFTDQPNRTQQNQSAYQNQSSY